ncbi:Phosphorylated carbohydrates phosphatase [Caprobacter fermentans]|uniref:HAD family phosphatase n=1 Tax=Caproicibacter fermentans TaxID=2576756 RepID=A0A6N8I4U4_9FIRM|nr:HAD family phosphatase [Caproicibacter fermentans]MVB12787.1 Phosphorylated carbohydrates phosphatase [Caproicibacter fermentans]OCN01556.1 hypothetical protein A7X67_08795 [Clostridium sp. W14A]QNK40314.1 HAD family phosphatase [Caproicibacter fermentans]
MVRAVIFDMDGLMFDTERLYDQAIEQAGNELGYSGIADLSRDMIGVRETDCVPLYQKRFGSGFSYPLFAARRQEIIDEFIRKNGVPVKPGLFELLRYLKQGGFRLAVATATSRRRASGYLEQTGAAGYFDRMIFGDMVEQCKPSPEIYLKAAEALGAAAEDCIALEDSPCGIQAACAAGMKAVMIPDLIEPDAALRKLCWSCEPSLTDVIKLVGETRSEEGAV